MEKQQRGAETGAEAEQASAVRRAEERERQAREDEEDEYHLPRQDAFGPHSQTKMWK